MDYCCAVIWDWWTIQILSVLGRLKEKWNAAIIDNNVNFFDIIGTIIIWSIWIDWRNAKITKKMYQSYDMNGRKTPEEIRDNKYDIVLSVIVDPQA